MAAEFALIAMIDLLLICANPVAADVAARSMIGWTMIAILGTLIAISQGTLLYRGVRDAIKSLKKKCCGKKQRKETQVKPIESQSADEVKQDNASIKDVESIQDAESSQVVESILDIEDVCDKRTRNRKRMVIAEEPDVVEEIEQKIIQNPVRAQKQILLPNSNEEE